MAGIVTVTVRVAGGPVGDEPLELSGGVLHAGKQVPHEPPNAQAEVIVLHHAEHIPGQLRTLEPLGMLLPQSETKKHHLVGGTSAIPLLCLS